MELLLNNNLLPPLSDLDIYIETDNTIDEMSFLAYRKTFLRRGWLSSTDVEGFYANKNTALNSSWIQSRFLDRLLEFSTLLCTLPPNSNILILPFRDQSQVNHGLVNSVGLLDKHHLARGWRMQYSSKRCISVFYSFRFSIPVADQPFLAIACPSQPPSSKSPL